MRIYTAHAATARRPGPEAASAAAPSPRPPAGSVPAAGQPAPVPSAAAPARGAPLAEAPLLVPEGFAWGAALTPGFWFLLRRMWLPGLAQLALVILILLFAPDALAPWLLLALQSLAGLEARDLWRRALARRGLPEVAVVAAPDEETALLRLLGQRPDLARGATA